MEVKEISKKKITPLVAIILGAIIFSAGLGIATWYWSKNLTLSITVEGQIVACSNFGNGDLIGVNAYTELEAKCVTEILPFGEQYIIRVASNGGNVATVFTSLEIILPGLQRQRRTFTPHLTLMVLSEPANY